MKRVISCLFLIVFMVSLIGIFNVSALNSPTPEDFYSINIYTKGSGILSTDKLAIQNGESFTIEATPEKDNTFIKWELNGNYEILNGSITDSIITILPKSDMRIFAVFKDGYTIETNPNLGNISNISPKTGQEDIPLYIIILCGAVLIFFAVYSYIQINNRK